MYHYEIRMQVRDWFTRTGLHPSKTEARVEKAQQPGRRPNKFEIPLH